MSHAYGPSALLTPANALTLTRIAIMPVSFMLLLERRLDFPTFLLWFLLCISDAFDGLLARRHGTTRSGAFLDPLADKILVLGGLWAMVLERVFWWPWVAMIAARELAISLYRSHLGRRGVSLPARRLAKYKTAVQQSAVGFAAMPWVGENATWAGKGCLFAGVALTLISGWLYARDASGVYSASRPARTASPPAPAPPM